MLVDGFPSLLRLSELLQKNPGYKVKLEGHTDRLGGDGYNDKLGMARANMVRDFLVKYGARPSQIDVTHARQSGSEISRPEATTPRPTKRAG